MFNSIATLTPSAWTHSMSGVLCESVRSHWWIQRHFMTTDITTLITSKFETYYFLLLTRSVFYMHKLCDLNLSEVTSAYYYYFYYYQRLTSRERNQSIKDHIFITALKQYWMDSSCQTPPLISIMSIIFDETKPFHVNLYTLSTSPLTL